MRTRLVVTLLEEAELAPAVPGIGVQVPVHLLGLERNALLASIAE